MHALLVSDRCRPGRRSRGPRTGGTVMRVAIAGAGKVGRSIAAELLGPRPRGAAHRPRGLDLPRRPVGRHLAAGRRVRDLVARRGAAADVPGRHRGHRRRQGQPGDLAAGQDRVRRPPGGRPRQPSQERVALQRRLGRRRRRLDAAAALRPGRRGRQRRRRRAADGVRTGRRQPRRAHPARPTHRSSARASATSDCRSTPRSSRSSATGGSSLRPPTTRSRPATSCSS